MLKNEKIALKADYYIDKVIDNRANQANIGVIIDQNLQKNKINFGESTTASIYHYLQKNISTPNTKNGIVLIINDLYIKEQIKTNRIIEGKCVLAVQFGKIREHDTLKIAETQAMYSFTRSPNNFQINYYEKIIRDMTTHCLEYFNNWLKNNAAKSEAFVQSSQVLLLPEAAISNEDTLYFSARKLNWTDFKAAPPQNSVFAAAVHPSIGFQAHFSVANNKVEAQVRPQIYVLKGMSWVKSYAKTDYALAHEQLHFNIAKIVLERFKQKIIKIEAKTMNDINSRIQYEYLESFREMNKMQEAYDGETNHGIIEEKQQEWAKKVEKQLADFQR